MTSFPADKRSLHRNSIKYGLDLKGFVFFGGNKIQVSVVDINSGGLRITLPNDLKSDFEKATDKIEVMFGSELICKCTNPRVVRFVDNDVVIDLRNAASTEKIPRASRVELSSGFQGILTGIDPFSVDQTLFFKVLNVSPAGLRISTSKVNGHLTKELVLRNFELQIPGFRKRKLSFQIRNIEVGEHELIFGCLLVDTPSKTINDLSVLRLILTDVSKGEISAEEVRMIIKKTKHFRGFIKVRYCRGIEDYQRVLDLRFRAYKAANKMSDKQTVSDMSDEHDKHAVILVASVGRNVVGTLRIVFREPNKPLPCERLIDLKNIHAIQPDRAAEVSRFAIDPLLQGSDIFIAISKQLVLELTMKQVAYPVCLATPSLAPSYISLGGIKVSDPVPHPILENETMSLYWLNPQNVYRGNTGSLSWFWVIRPALKRLESIGSIESVPSALHQYFLFFKDFLKLLISKKTRSIKKLLRKNKK